MMTNLHLEVVISEQLTKLFQGPDLQLQFPCSTASRGIGSENGSLCTPTGRFHIAEKIGDQAPIGSIFKSRLLTGERWDSSKLTPEDLILTRILWLAGDEPHNRNTLDRFIYFHGTNHEDKLGTPASHGCIRLRNTDMITLFDSVLVGTPVFIREN
jgi:L,D-transpeptidase YbiS